tara:strand:- start:153 stop:491 length:339 start_codon:yes stop_codon:yes gene_type:complete
MFVVVAEVVYEQEIDSSRLFTESLGELVLIGCAGKIVRQTWKVSIIVLKMPREGSLHPLSKVSRDQQLEKDLEVDRGVAGLAIKFLRILIEKTPVKRFAEPSVKIILWNPVR